MAYRLCALGCGPRGPGSTPGSHPRVREQAQGVVHRTPPPGGAVLVLWAGRLLDPSSRGLSHWRLTGPYTRRTGLLQRACDTGSTPVLGTAMSSLLVFWIFTIEDMIEETSQDAYDRGVIAGEIAARLANHDVHFASINGHIKDLVMEIHGMRLNIQRLADQAEASAKTVIATATALRAADEARSTSSTRSWTPWARSFAVLSATATIISIITMIIVLKT
jgi:hypothetical protein